MCRDTSLLHHHNQEQEFLARKESQLGRIAESKIQVAVRKLEVVGAK
jgi:hypothetical protein